MFASAFYRSLGRITLWVFLGYLVLHTSTELWVALS